MIKDISAIKLGQIWNDGRGATFKDTIQATPSLGPQTNLRSPINAELMLIRMKEGVSVVLDNLETSVDLECARCLTPYQQKILVPQIEVHFFSSANTTQQEDIDNFPINLKDLSIDLTEAIRQEIILHFPLIPVCSKRCKGLCPECRANLNREDHKKDCHYQVQEAEISVEEGVTRPFANLKDLFKN